MIAAAATAIWSARRSPPPELSRAQQVVPRVPALLPRRDDDRLRDGEGDPAADAGARPDSGSLEPFGHFSPMGVLWYSIGASKSYEMFAGFMELACGVLLFVPRLATLGALVTFADHDADLHAEHDLRRAGEAVLVSPDPDVAGADRARGVAASLNVARLQPHGGAVDAAAALPAAARWCSIALAVQLGYGAYPRAGRATPARTSPGTSDGGGAPKSPLYGIWNIETMTIDGHDPLAARHRLRPLAARAVPGARPR